MGRVENIGGKREINKLTINNYIITIELLESKEACEDGLNYFGSLRQDSYEILDLIKQCCEDGEQDYADWLFEHCRKLFTKTTFKSVVEYYKERKFDLDDAFKFCKELFTKATFKSVVEYQMKNKFGLHYAFKNCNKLFTAELFESAVEYYKERKFGLHYAFKNCNKLFTKATFKSAAEYHIKNHLCLARARECQEYLIKMGTLEKEII